MTCAEILGNGQRFFQCHTGANGAQACRLDGRAISHRV